MSKLQKEIILGFVVLVLGVFSWYFLKYVFYVGNLTLNCWIPGIILLIVWGSALALAMLLIDNKNILYGSFILILVAFGMFFNNEPFYYLAALIILFLAFWFGVRKIRKEEKVQVSLDFWRIWKRGLPILITALILLISLAYYFSPKLMETKQFELKISRSAFDLVIKPLESLIKERLPVEEGGLETKADKVLSQEEKQDLERRYEIAIEPEDTVKDVLYKLVNYQVNNFSGPYRRFVPIGLAIGLFIALKIISLIYIPLVILLSYLILKLLMLLKFVKVEIETREVETVKL